MGQAAFSWRNAYRRAVPMWHLVTDRDGAVVESLRRHRVGDVIDVPEWGCLVTICRGLRVGVVAVTDAGAIFPVTPEDDEASWAVGPARSGDRFALTRVGLDGSRRTAAWTIGGELDTDPPNAPADAMPTRIRRVGWPTHGGTLEGLLATPAGGGPHPLVVYLHGGPWFGLRVGEVGDSAFWTKHGAALLQSDYAGSGILGEKMMWEPLRSVGMPERDLDADGVLDGVDQLVAAGIADPARLYVYGFSAGGYLVNRIVTRQHPFAAAACWDGPADVRTFTGNTRDIQIFFRGCTPEARPDLWDGASPMSRPEAVTTPLTIISGGQSNVRADSAAWHAALTRAGADSDLVVYPDEDHLFSSPAHLAALKRLARSWVLP